MIANEPPARAVLPTTRRGLLRGAGAVGSLIAMPLAAQAGRRGFTHGVASG